MTFKASLDGLAKAVTISISIFFAIIVVGQVIIFHSESPITALLTLIIIPGVYFATYLFRPIDYEVTNGNLIIHRTIKNVVIDRKTIKSVQTLTKDQMKWTIRTFGVGGLFGYYGQFVNSKLGNMTWYATRRDNTILIETIANKKYVVTPDEPLAFINQLQPPIYQ